MLQLIEFDVLGKELVIQRQHLHHASPRLWSSSRACRAVARARMIPARYGACFQSKLEVRANPTSQETTRAPCVAISIVWYLTVEYCTRTLTATPVPVVNPPACAGRWLPRERNYACRKGQAGLQHPRERMVILIVSGGSISFVSA